LAGLSAHAGAACLSAFEYPFGLLASILWLASHSQRTGREKAQGVVLLLPGDHALQSGRRYTNRVPVWMPMAVAWGIVVFASLRLIPIGQFSVHTPSNRGSATNRLVCLA
jgi:hypothetical protein